MPGRMYHIKWWVPPAKGDGTAIVHASDGLPASSIAQGAADQMTRLAEQCPAGGIMPEPHEGERFALRCDGIVVTDDPVPPAELIELVLLDRTGEAYDHAELARTK